MAFDVANTLTRLLTYLSASGHVGQAQIGERKQPIGVKLAADVWMQRAGVVSTTLGTTIELHVVIIRLYRDAFSEPSGDIEKELGAAASNIISDLLGEFDLGATIRNVDAGGQYGTPVGVEWGHVEIGGKMHRVADVTLGLIVDDAHTFAS